MQEILLIETSNIKKNKCAIDIYIYILIIFF